MKLFVVFVAICLAETYGQISVFRTIFEKLHGEPPPPPPVFRNNINVGYIEQKVDNFDANDRRTWYMRYMYNDFYFKSNGPIFIFIGGEWEISDGYLRGGHMFDMARNHSGYMFYTEHRYYGRSQPFLKWETNNLKYLNVKQALADLANFIIKMKATTPGLQFSKVILVGGSYSATMATWFSQMYPQLVDGAWSSSAPLKAKVDFVEYKEVVGASIKTVGGDECYDRIKNAITILEEEMDKGQLELFEKHINLCPTFDAKNENDVMNLFASLSDIFSGLVQGHNKGNIEYACNMIMSGSDDLDGIARFIRTYLGAGTQCLDLRYEDDVQELRNTAVAADGIMRQWYYQTCNEFGWYQTSGSANQPFGKSFPVDLYINLCRDVYDMDVTNNQIDENIQATNREFGELQPQVKNVYSTHGSLDPWHAMGLVCEGECGIKIPLYAHCKDLGSISLSDTPEMLKAKQTIADLVSRWVS